MKRALEAANKFFDIPLDLRSRILILLAALLILPSLMTPLWRVTFQSERYPGGLELNVYSHKLVGGKEADLSEINALNTNLGIRSLDQEQFIEFRWLPFVMGVVLLLALRAVVLGKMSKLVDLFFLVLYAGVFALWSFRSTLYAYGHAIDSVAPAKIEPFTLPLIGSVTVQNVAVSSAPELGAYCMVAVPLVLLTAVLLSHRTWRAEQEPKHDYIG